MNRPPDLQNQFGSNFSASFFIDHLQAGMNRVKSQANRPRHAATKGYYWPARRKSSSDCLG